jgi:hypothetical protein
MERTKLSNVEKGIRDLLAGAGAVWIYDRDIDMSVFSQYPREKEGIAVYYPLYKDGSCASAEYIHFYRSTAGMSMDRATFTDYRIMEKERIGHLLRR